MTELSSLSSPNCIFNWQSVKDGRCFTVRLTSRIWTPRNWASNNRVLMFLGLSWPDCEGEDSLPGENDTGNTVMLTPVAMMVMRLLASLLKMLEVSLRLSTLMSKFLNWSWDWNSSNLFPIPPSLNFAWLRKSDTILAMTHGISRLKKTQTESMRTANQAIHMVKRNKSKHFSFYWLKLETRISRRMKVSLKYQRCG